MAAILKLRRGISPSPALVDGELFLNYSTGTIQFSSGSTVSNLLPLGKSITGSVNLYGDITASNLLLSGDITARDFSGRDVRLSGNIFLGDEIADSIVTTGQFSGSLIPSASATYDLGSDTKNWKSLYVVSASIEDINGINIDSFISGTNAFTSSQENINSLYNTFTQSAEQRLGSIETFTQSIDSRVNTLETTFSSSVDLRLDLLENFSSSEYQQDSSSFDSRLDVLENFSSSEYQIDSSSFDDRITDLTIVTGSYATTGSNIFIGNETISGSLQTSGSVNFRNIPWPSVGNESHLFKTDPYVGEFTSGDRNYGYLGVALEQISTGSWYENSLLIYTYDDHDNPTYGSELNVGPLRNHIRVLPSGSNHYGNLSLEDVEDGTSRALLYADNIQIGVFTGSAVTIGNSNSDVVIGTNTLTLSGSVFSYNEITASEFIGDGSKLTNVTASYVEYDDVVNKPTLVSGSSQIDVNDTQNFQLFSSSVDSRIDTIEGPFSSSVNQQLDNIHSYTASLKTSIDVSGNDLTVLGNLTVQGTQTSLNTTEVLVEDKLLALASGSTTSVQADGGGIFISGANASFTWNHSDQLVEFNTKVSSSVGFKGDGSELTGVTAAAIEFDDILNKPTLVSGSSQIDLTQTTNYVSGIKTRLNAEGIFSQSAQVDADFITNFDSNVLSYINSENVHSGSYLGTATTSDLDEGINLYYTDLRVKTKLNLEGVVTGSPQISFPLISDIPAGIVSGSTQITDGSGIVSGSSQVTQSLDGRYLKINGDSVISSSLQITDGSGILSSSVQDFETFSGSVDSRIDSLESNTHTHSNKSNLDVIDQNLSQTDSPTFSNLSLENLSSLGSGEVNAVFSGSAGTLGTRSLGTAAFFNVSASVGDDPNSIPTNKAVSDALIAAGAGDITAINDSSLYSSTTTGILHTGEGTPTNGYYGQQGNVVIAIDTGSNHFIAGVNGVVQLGDGIVSSSEQISNYNVFAELNGDGLVSSSQQISNYNTFLEINGDGVISSSAQLTTEFDSRYLNTNGDSVVSGSSQIDITQTTNFTLFSSSLDSRLDIQEGFSESIDTTIKTKMNLDGVLSGSGQITNGSGIVSSSQQISNYNVFAELNGQGIVSSSAQILNGSGIVSSSEQISNYNTFLEINGDGVISGSDQLTGSLVDKTSDQTISGTKTFQDIVVNGTGSFAYLQSTQGSAKIIGDSFIILNNDTPTQRYAGISVQDSGSVGVTSSLQYDGQTDDWFYEYSTDGGVTTDHGVILFGPEYSGIGNPSYPTNNRIQKGNGGHHLLDSNITDTGTLITLGSAVDVTGVTNFNNTTNSTSKTTGAVIIDGGVGIAKTLNVGEDVVAYSSSDRRLKDEVTPISNSLEKINQIGGYSFVWNDKQDIYKGKDYGVIAQEIEEILPELVETRENGYKAVKYDRIVSLLIEGVKELSKEVSELKEKIGK